MEGMIRFSHGDTTFIQPHEFEHLEPEMARVHNLIHLRQGPGHEYAGWVDLPLNYDRRELINIIEAGEDIKDLAEVFIVIGVGGSYLGARSALELLQHSFYNHLPAERRQGPEIYFAGFNMSPSYLRHLLELIGERDFAINIISKSGTTLEPALSFRIFHRLLEKRYGKKGAKKRIIVTTDRSRGALKKLADEEGYTTFSIPDDIGGRYSVLTAVGLLPITVGGIDIGEVMRGAEAGHGHFGRPELAKNPSYQYAAARNILYLKGKIIELLATYDPAFLHFAEWWKQLFGESEGKDGKGIFPASVSFTRDLHSLGQLVQDGYRNLFTTTLWVEEPVVDQEIKKTGEDMDGLNYLAGRTFHFVNDRAHRGTMTAHASGGVPTLKISLPRLTPFYYGQMVYFFEKACAASAYLLGVNPFNQPGVETYKENMFTLLKEPIEN
ncbi:MAG: glucose-6-phosphate isomerase [Dethiobacteria bacterium]|jgi:glucose-6-phosphate isomerase